MMPLRIGGASAGRLSVLCLGAHCDDIEIGCGGTILRLIDEVADLHVDWIVFASNNERRAEAERSAELFLDGCATRRIAVESFRESYFPWVGAELKDYFAALAARGRPDLVLTHARDDRHQDHRTIAELTWNGFRDHLILEYEIPKWDGDLGRPNLYVPLDEAIAERKVQTLLDAFPSQRSRHWFDADTFRGLLRLRGMECNAPARFAEAFHAHKLVL
jgi:LmbE family N-acetylglucosaminyl deacetylase